MPVKRPNIVLIMADQLAASVLPTYGHPLVKTPNIDSLAERGVVFENAYTNYPLCAPARFAMMAGQLCSKIGAWDNAAEFASEVPTISHYLRALEYRTCLSGKMHFIGADQLHGFEERLTTDMCPADFNWTADWDQPDRLMPWFHNMKTVAEAGVAERALQQDYDDDVAHCAVRRIYDWAREPEAGPFFLLASFVHPHDPYVTPQRYWDRYDHDEIDLPAVPAIPLAERDPHSARLYHNFDRGEYEITEDAVRNARHAYYGNVSLIDDKVGEILEALRVTRRLDDTVLLFTADHGDLLGERGLWFKNSFLEGSARVPLIIAAPDLERTRRTARNCSLIDLLPTLVELAGDGKPPRLTEPIDGRSLLALMGGDEDGWDDVAIGEMLGEPLSAPYVMLRRGRYKYLHSETDPPQLFDLEADPNELNDLADDPECAGVREELAGEVGRLWDFPTLRERIIASQRRRRLVYEALIQGHTTPWDFQPWTDASKLYYRGAASYHMAEDRDLLRF